MTVKTGDMYSGMTSGSFGTNKAVKKQQKAIKAAKQELRSVILPSYNQLIEDIDAELIRVDSLRTYTTGGYVTDDETRFELAARRRYIDLLDKLKAKYQSAMKETSHE